MLHKTGHSIWAATDPRMYKYLPARNETIFSEMMAATTFIVSKTSQSLKVLSKVVKCALIEDCMAPPNSTTICVYENLWKGKYGYCHRFDQSALALSLAQCSPNMGDYVGLSDRVYVKRRWVKSTKG